MNLPTVTRWLLLTICMFTNNTFDLSIVRLLLMLRSLHLAIMKRCIFIYLCLKKNVHYIFLKLSIIILIIRVDIKDF